MHLHHLEVKDDMTPSSQPGDIVYVHTGQIGNKEGLVIGAHFDYAVRSTLKV
jgi:hypothetical protein